MYIKKKKIKKDKSRKLIAVDSTRFTGIVKKGTPHVELLMFLLPGKRVGIIKRSIAPIFDLLFIYT